MRFLKYCFSKYQNKATHFSYIASHELILRHYKGQTFFALKILANIFCTNVHILQETEG